MKSSVFGVFAVLLIFSVATFAQSPKAATYITDEQVKSINASPGVDRQIVSVDIGKLNEAVGIIHRGPTTPPTAGRGAGGGAATGAAAAGGAARGAAAQAQPCGEQMSTPPEGSTPGGISHDH